MPLDVIILANVNVFISVDAMFNAMSDCQALHPDEEDEFSEEGISLYTHSVYVINYFTSNVFFTMKSRSVSLLIVDASLLLSDEGGYYDEAGGGDNLTERGQATLNRLDDMLVVPEEDADEPQIGAQAANGRQCPGENHVP